MLGFPMAVAPAAMPLPPAAKAAATLLNDGIDTTHGAFLSSVATRIRRTVRVRRLPLRPPG